MQPCWRLGLPGCQIAAFFGLPIKIKIDICRDDEANVYFATSDDIGLAVESDNLDALMKEIHAAVPMLLSVAHSPVRNPKTEIRLHDCFVAA